MVTSPSEAWRGDRLRRPALRRRNVAAAAGVTGMIGAAITHRVLREIDNAPPQTASGLGTSALEARGLTKRYPALLAVDHVGFTIAPGEILGYLGPNGLEQVRPSTWWSACSSPPGSLLLSEARLTSQPEDYKRRIGYVSRRTPPVHPPDGP